MVTKENTMPKEDALMKFRAAQWALVSRFQERVMPLIYGLGTKLDIMEIDIKPRSEHVIVYSEFHDRSTIFDFEVIHPPHLIGDIEMVLDHLPEKVPVSLFDKLPKFEECEGLHAVVNNDRLMLRMPFARISGPDELLRMLESLAEQGDKLMSVFLEADEDDDMEGRIKEALSEDVVAARVLN